MGITDKFGNFQIKKSDRISQEDQAWLTHREELYKRAIAVYKSVYDIYKAENESYSEEDRKITSILLFSQEFWCPKIAF